MTLATPLCVHIILCDVPAFQLSPPFGAVTVSVGCAIVKTALLTSLVTALVASLTRTRAWLVKISGTVHAKLPAEAGVLATTVFQLEPLFEEYSIKTFAIP